MATFEGFGERGLHFLKAIGFHQSREWFAENKALYESELKAPMAVLLDDVSARMKAAGIPLSGSAKASTFRINRDVRFTKEKHPYNQHVSAVLTRTGDKKDMGGLYVHVSPGRTLLASGLWHPTGPMLRALREDIVARPDTLLEIEAGLARHGLAFKTDEMLVKGPAGFKGDHGEDVGRLLRYKSFVVEQPLDDAIVTTPELVDAMLTLAERALPLLNYGWRITDPLRETEPRGTEDKRRRS
ncbi:MAG: TIGR02453 family protein [Pseudomonadota bacterium]